MNRALGVERVLLKRVFAVVMSALGVKVSPMYVMRSPPTVMRMRYGSAFCGR